jgi:hypothetical protein
LRFSSGGADGDSHQIERKASEASGQLLVSAARNRDMFALDSFQPRHHEDAGNESQPEILGLFDGVVNFLDQGSGSILSKHANLLCLWRISPGWA